MIIKVLEFKWDSPLSKFIGLSYSYMAAGYVVRSSEDPH